VPAQPAGGSQPVSLPPRRPQYEPPRRWSDIAGGGRFDERPGALDPLYRAVPKITLPRTPAWDELDGGGRLEARVGDLHPSRAAVVGESLLLRASGAGEHELRWRAYSKSANRPTEGTIILSVPADEPARGAFGRLYGLRAYPDLPLLDEDGEVKYAGRTSDPPLQPPPVTGDDDLTRRLRERAAARDWAGLGLDPAADGPQGEVWFPEPEELDDSA